MKNLKNILPYLLAPALSLLVLVLMLRLWNADLSLPIFGYENDTLSVAFIIKNIIDTGWFSSNDFVGWPHFSDTFYFHDFPLHADFFNFAIIKIFACFSSDSFLILNSFFVATFALSSLSSLAVLKHFKISSFTAILISLLYAFVPYHFSRGVNHLFLANYAVVPLIIMVALWIMSDKIQVVALNKKKQISFEPNAHFLIAFLIAIFAAINGIYYAFYSCIIFIFAWFLRGVRKAEFADRNLFLISILCAMVICVIFCLSLPSFVYWTYSGANMSLGRAPEQSELFALKIINLFLPVQNHYVDYFANLRGMFDRFAVEEESGAESLGIIGSIGFLFLLMWPLVKTQSGEKSILQKTIKKFSLKVSDQILIANLAGLNLLSVLFATVGGFVMFIAISFPQIRSHARFSIFIAFFSLFLIAIIFDKILKQKKFAQVSLLILTLLALFDQVGRASVTDEKAAARKSKFISDKNFVQNIECEMPKGVKILQLPVFGFPEGGSYELLRGYLHSKNLHWSYPAIIGRESNLWQNKIMKLDFDDFIAEVKKSGFDGIYINRVLFAERYGWNDLRRFEERLKAVQTKSTLASRDLKLVFYKI